MCVSERRSQPSDGMDGPSFPCERCIEAKRRRERGKAALFTAPSLACRLTGFAAQMRMEFANSLTLSVSRDDCVCVRAFEEL